jgi:TolB-like protein
MFMKAIRIIITLCVIALSLISCAGQAASVEQAPVLDALTFDQAIADIAAYFTGRLPAASTVAITSFEAETENLSAYAIEELWNCFEKAGGFVMIDRRNVEKIRDEIRYQLSGEVSDESARAIGKQYGVQYIIYGSLTRIGGEYRIAAYATDVEKASSAMRAITVRPDERLSALSGKGQTSLEAEIDKAVAGLGRSLAGRMTIAIGRISLSGTGTVTNLSDYLKTSITHSALQQAGKYEVAGDSVSGDYAVSAANLTRDIFVEDTPVHGTQASVPIQGVVEGEFSPLGEDAQVTLRLVSARDNKALGSSRFVIPAAEMQKRDLSLYPPKNDTVISRAEFEAKQAAIAPFGGRDNAFGFTVKADDLDGVYHAGQYMTMRLYAEKDCYFRILHVGVGGNVQTLYPRSPGDDNFIKAGQTRRIPDNTRFKIAAPFGEEYILAAAYSSRFEAALSGGAMPPGTAGLTRDIIVEEEQSHKEMRPLATAKFSYTTLP